MAAAFAVTVFAGFARTYYLRPFFESKPLVSILHLHGLVFTSWVVLFVVQTALVAKRRTGVHRLFALSARARRAHARVDCVRGVGDTVVLRVLIPA